MTDGSAVLLRHTLILASGLLFFHCDGGSFQADSSNQDSATDVLGTTDLGTSDDSAASDNIPAEVGLQDSVTSEDSETGDLPPEDLAETCEPTCATPCLQSGMACEFNDCGSTCCLQVVPIKLDFGAVLTGDAKTLELTVTPCCPSPVEVKTIALYSDTPGTLASVSPPSLPAFLEPDAPLVFGIEYAPDMASPTDEDGVPIPHTGHVEVISDCGDTLSVPIQGIGVSNGCPTPVIKIVEGDEVEPGTMLHLSGADSFDPGGDDIVKWNWTVEQPSGSNASFVPSAQHPAPTFQANVAGMYKFSLTVENELEVPSCTPAQKTVYVTGPFDLLVEMLWEPVNPPANSTESPDMDLHFAHPHASLEGPDLDGDGEPDPWFDMPWDCFWFNANPNWGSYDPEIPDDPSLNEHPVDPPKGMETVHLEKPEDLVYRVGVHYWNDKNMGPAFVSVRIYMGGALVFELDWVELAESAMWEVAAVNWADKTVELLTNDSGGYKILPDYNNPYFFQ